MGTHPEQYARDGGGSMDEIHANILIAVTMILHYRKIQEEGLSQ